MKIVILTIWNLISKIVKLYENGFTITFGNKGIRTKASEWLFEYHPYKNPFWKLPIKERERIIRKALSPSGDLGRRLQDK